MSPPAHRDPARRPTRGGIATMALFAILVTTWAVACREPRARVAAPIATAGSTAQTTPSEPLATTPSDSSGPSNGAPTVTATEPTDGGAAPPSAPAASTAPPKVGHGPDARKIARAADAALARAARCPVDRALAGRTFPVTVTATPDGRLRAEVGYIDINPPDAWDGLLARPPRECIDEQFEVETVPPFDGAPVVLERKLTTPRR
ncbi:MAG: hypothetical protein JST00_13835 [Deltaproteobacteria bacterium]|nr:hypothetical protein [Deltaproteobacteria bacterium]